MRHTAASKLRALCALVCLVALTAASRPVAVEEDCPRVSTEVDEPRIYSIAVDYCDARGPQILTSGWSPRLSPDRTQVAFARRHGMWIMNVDGTEPRLLLDGTPTGGFCSNCTPHPRLWLPGGQQIVFDYGGGFSTYLGMVGVDGSNPRKLGYGGVDQGAWPSPLSPDGTMLMLGDQPDVTPYLGAVVIATGTKLGFSNRTYTGSWSPDSKWVAFTYLTSVTGRTGLEVVRVDGSEQMDVAAAVRGRTGAAFEPESLVTWSADGTELAVEDRSRGQLVAVRVDGTSLRAADAHFPVFRESDPTAVPQATWGEVKEGAR